MTIKKRSKSNQAAAAVAGFSTPDQRELAKLLLGEFGGVEGFARLLADHLRSNAVPTSDKTKLLIALSALVNRKEEQQPRRSLREYTDDELTAVVKELQFE